MNDNITKKSVLSLLICVTFSIRNIFFNKNIFYNITAENIPWVPEAFHARFPVSSLPESGCFADWFFGDGECFKRFDWITTTIGA